MTRAVKITLALMEYKCNIFRTSAAKAHMAWKREETVSRVFTVLGTTGFVLGAVPMKDEAACIIRDTLTRLVGTTCLHVWSTSLLTSQRHVSTLPCILRRSSALGDEVQDRERESRVSRVMLRLSCQFSVPGKGGSSPNRAQWQWQRAPATTEFQAVILRHMSACDPPDSLMRFAGTLTEEDGFWLSLLSSLQK